MGSEISFFFWRFPLATFRERDLEKRLRNLNLPFGVAESGFLRWPTSRPPAKIWRSACASRSCGRVQTGAQGGSRRPDPSRRRRRAQEGSWRRAVDCLETLTWGRGREQFHLNFRRDFEIICIVSLMTSCAPHANGNSSFLLLPCCCCWFWYLVYMISEKCIKLLISEAWFSYERC